MMREAVTEGLIYVEDDLGIQYKLAKISYTEREDESFEYVFEPCYEVIDLLRPPLFQGIPGLDLELRKDRYVRADMVPVFIAERTPSPQREDLWQLLEACGMDHLNRLEWLIRTDLRYSGDRMMVRRWLPMDEKRTLALEEVWGEEVRSARKARRLLEVICQGHDVTGGEMTVSDQNRSQVYRLLYELYRDDALFCKGRQKEGLAKAKEAGKMTGRKPIDVDLRKLDEACRGFLRGSISAKEAAYELGVSIATFRRRVKRLYPGGLDG